MNHLELTGNSNMKGLGWTQDVFHRRVRVRSTKACEIGGFEGFFMVSFSMKLKVKGVFFGYLI